MIKVSRISIRFSGSVCRLLNFLLKFTGIPRNGYVVGHYDLEHKEWTNCELRDIYARLGVARRLGPWLDIQYPIPEQNFILMNRSFGRVFSGSTPNLYHGQTESLGHNHLVKGSLEAAVHWHLY